MKFFISAAFFLLYATSTFALDYPGFSEKIKHSLNQVKNSNEVKMLYTGPDLTHSMPSNQKSSLISILNSKWHS